MAVKDWKQIRNRTSPGMSVVYKKENIILEIFRDSSWYGRYANVIIYDQSQKSLSSSFGKVIHVEYFDSTIEAERYAKSYMRKN
jgi:hypothetical protein